MTSMCRETILTLPRIHRFARRTRDYCREYFKLEKDAAGADSKDSIEKMPKTCKAHRNINDMQPGFIVKQQDLVEAFVPLTDVLGWCGNGNMFVPAWPNLFQYLFEQFLTMDGAGGGWQGVR